MVTPPERPLRVAHVISSVAPRHGGPSAAIVEMVMHLRKIGVDAEIIATNDDGPGKLECVLHELSEYRGVPVRFFDRFSPPLPPVRNFSYSGALRQWLGNHLTGYDVLHVHGLFQYAPTASMCSARRLGIPYVVRPLGHLDPWSLAQKRAKKRLYLNLVERKNLDHAALIHCMSPQEEKSVVDLGIPARTRIIPHGINPSKEISGAPAKLRESLGLPPDEPVLLFLSRWHYKKGIEFLIPALESLKDRRFTLVLAGCGEPEYEGRIRALVSGAGLTNRVLMPGFLGGDEKELYLQGSSLFLLPSYAENFGIALLEALAAGLPALVSAEVALSEFVKEIQAGYIVPLDVAGIREALARFLSESPSWTTGRREGIRTATLNRFSWQAACAALAEEYRSLAGSF